MKRKLALLLSVIMMLAAIPVSAQTSDNRLTRSSLNLPNYTLLYESGLTTGGSGRITGNSGILEYWIDGSDLVIEVRNRIPGDLAAGTSGMFRVGLDNARFFFRNNTEYTVDLSALPASYGLNAATLAALAARYPNLVTEAGGVYSAHNRIHNQYFTGTFEGGADTTRTFDTARGAYANHRYLRFGRDITVPTGTAREVAYMMEVSMANESSATIILLEEAVQGDRIVIPIVSRTYEAGTDVTVAVDGTGTSIQSGRFLLASGMGGRTSTRATGTVTSRTDFDLREIVIAEQRIASIRNGAGFELIAPSGFYFGNLNNIQVHVEPGLSWVGDRTGSGMREMPGGWTPPPWWPAAAGLGAVHADNFVITPGYIATPMDHVTPPAYGTPTLPGNVTPPAYGTPTLPGNVTPPESGAATTPEDVIGTSVNMAQTVPTPNTDGNTTPPTGTPNTDGNMTPPAPAPGTNGNTTPPVGIPGTDGNMTPPIGTPGTNVNMTTPMGASAGFSPFDAPTWRPDFTVAYRERAGRTDRSAIQFNLQHIRESTRLPGRIIITGATLIADEPDMVPTQGREISLTIRNWPSGTSFTEETFVVGRMSDYLVTMERRGDVRELISGRLDSPIVRTGATAGGRLAAPLGITDETHRAADVRVEESIPSSWWAQRNTEFRLPEGVKILKARFLNLNHLDAESITALTNNPESEHVADFFNTHSRTNSSVLIRDNLLSLSRLRVTGDTNRARFDIRLWLNIDVDFEGDIDLTLSGSSVMNDANAPSVTIARATRPIEVHTRVSDIRIGYQFISVADFDIVENVAGGLRRGESVYISVTDEISIDMHIAPGLRAGVTDGNIRISNVLLRSALGHTGDVLQGQLRFDVERESTEASTISFTDVQVKANTNVPFSNVGINNERGINLIVWGPAVAQNFEGLMNSKRAELSSAQTLQTRDFFPTPGIRAHYINVTTPAPGGTQRFTNEVRATIGNPVILINGNQYTIPVAPYVSPASNSTMVPVRFISLALGLPEDAIRWDPTNSTVTVDAGTRIVQFQTGSYHYTVNGVSMPMVSPDGRPVAMEIREERAFVPFRALGEAFGIRVTWEQETSTAIFNERV